MENQEIRNATYTTPPQDGTNAVVVFYGTTLSCDNVLFQGVGVGKSKGVAIYAAHNSAITISNSTFSANTVEYSYEPDHYFETQGVAIFHGYASEGDTFGFSANITDCYFDGNSGDIASGAAFYGNGVLFIDGSTFTNNSVSFDGNTHGGDGGAVYNRSMGLTEFDITAVSEITASTFSNNYADVHGGAVYLGGDIICIDVKFESNTCGVDGGAVWISSQIDGDPSLFEEVTIISNTTGSDGGGLYNENELTSSVSTYSYNTAGGNGGGVFNFWYLESTEDFFSNNTAINGGAIYNDGDGWLVIDSSTLINNTAEEGGGAIYSGVDACFEIYSSTISENIATDGGALYNDGDGLGEGLIEDSVFERNTADNGGGIYNYSGVIEIYSSTFSDNTVTGFGGAIYNDEEGVLMIDSSTFSNNIAGEDGGAIYNAEEGVIHISGSTFVESSQSIKNHGDVFFSGSNILNAVLDGDGLSHSEDDETVIKGAGTIGQTYVAEGFETTFGAADSGMNIDATIIGGGTDYIADSATLHFINATMTSTSSVYGAGVAVAGESYTADSVSIDFTSAGMGAKALVCAGGKGAARASIEVGTITVTSSASGNMGILYGGADLTDGGSFEATAITTTISGNGNYLSFVGNGCRNGNTAASGVITTNIGTSIVSISGGTFNNLVYGGAYAAGDNVTCGTANMSISGGTFNFSVYGGNGGKSTATTQNGKSIVENVNVTIDVTGSNTVVFNRHLSSGSFGDGTVSGDTHMTFTGDGANLTFGANSYVSGHSQNAYHFSASRIQTFVEGSSYLTFDSFTGEFKGSLSNGFTNVSFSSDSSVVLKGAVESDLRFTSVWDFAVGSATDTLLDWSKATKAKNSFEGDTINLTLKEAFTGSKVLMNFGTDDKLFTGWDSATVKLGGSTMTYNFDNKYYSDGSYKLYVDTTSGNRLMLASL